MSNEKEIKRAYIKMLRKYPPEKSPEEFKKIRESYERLSNPISRAEYDAFFEYKDQIEQHIKIGDEALEKEEYKIAIKEYKKVLIIEPKLTFAKNKLGLAFIYNGQYNEALIQFQELIKINDTNAIYYANMAYVYKMMKNYEEAENIYLKAHEIDYMDDNIILDLIDIYIIQKEYNKAIIFLRSCLGKNKEDAFQDFIYYFEMLNVYTYSYDLDNIDRLINEIEEIIPNDIESREYVSWKFGKLAYELLQENLYDLSAKVSRKALEFNDSNESIRDVYNTSNKINKALFLYEKLDKDNRIIHPLKGPIYYYLYADEYEDEELDKCYNKNLNAIQSYIATEFINVIKSIDILKKEYTILYEYRKEIYEEFYTICEKNKTHNFQCNNFKNDNKELSTKNSSEGGCATIFVCAIIGAFLIPVFGVFIGAFIGYKISN